MAAICISLAAGAQDKQWKIALHVDPNVSWMKPDDKNIEQGDTKLKFGFGVMIDKMFTNNYAFSTGFKVINTGGELIYFFRENPSDQHPGKALIAERDRTYNLKYLEIPLTLKLRTNEIGYITYWAQIGVGLGFNIKSKGDETLTYKLERTEFSDGSVGVWKEPDPLIPVSSSEDDDIKDDIGLFRTSLIIAGGIEYNLAGNASILLGITFNNGFNNVLNNQGIKANTAGSPDVTGNTAQEFKLKSINNQLALNVGILF